MADDLYAIIVGDPDIENSSGILGGRKPILSSSVEKAKDVIECHIFDFIDFPEAYKLTYKIVPWFGQDHGDPVWIVEKDGCQYKKYDPRKK